VHRVQSLTAANLVTATRIALAGGVAVAAAVDGPQALMGALLAVALLSDFVDGRLARWTGTASAFGARLDMEADALLILVLSVVVAADVGWWVLWLGLVRYGFAALVACVPRLRVEPPPRPWCKVVAAVVAGVLAVAAVGVLADTGTTLALAGASVLLAESFVHEAADRWRVSAPAPVRMLTPSDAHA
jgi:phosphatidylglycerophosphate synthase